MGYNKDYPMRTIARWKEGLPVDEEGHFLDRNDMVLPSVPWQHPCFPIQKPLARTLTSPYGALHFAAGSEDDFYCFDYAELPDGRIVLESVINSETGSFIMGADYFVCKPEDAARTAGHMVDTALDWMYSDPGCWVEHDKEGWNQDPFYFARAVANTVGTLGCELTRIHPETKVA